MRLPDTLISGVRSMVLLMRTVFAVLHAGSRYVTSAVLRRLQPPSDLVVTTKAGGRHTGVLLVDQGRVRASLARLAEHSSRSIDETLSSALASRPPSHATSQCGDTTPVSAEDEDEEDEDETWGH